MIRRIKRWWNPADEILKTHRHVRLAISIALFCLCVTGIGVIVWQRQTQRQAELASYQTELIDWRRCNDRAESGVQIAAVNDAAVAHAQETAGAIAATAETFDEIVDVFEGAGGSERLVTVRRLVNAYSAAVAEYQAGVDNYRKVADAYQPQDPDDCPPKPDPLDD